MSAHRFVFGPSRRLLFAALALVVGCGGGGVENTGPAPDPMPQVVEPEAAPVEEMPQVEVQPVEESEPEPELTPMELARAAVEAGRFGEAERAFQGILGASAAGSAERVEALLNLGLLLLIVPDEPDLEGARERLEAAQAIATGPHRLEVASVIKLLDEIQARDETVRRLTRLIGQLPA